MAEAMDELEERISDLRSRVRRALADRDRAHAASLRSELREAEYQWDIALHAAAEELAPEPPSMSMTFPTALLPVREHVHQALTLLTVPSAPRLIVAVHEAFFSGDLATTQLASLRRDEERSFRSAPHGRPYYLCSALTAERLTPARGLLAVSTWPTGRRIVGSLSARVDFLTAAIRIGEHLERIGEPSPQARRLLWRFATNIPHAAGPFDAGNPSAVMAAAREELAVHEQADSVQREAASRRVRQLDEALQLFGVQPIGLARGSIATD